MTINKLMLGLASNAKTKSSTNIHLWSNSFRHFIIYTLLRSRGFAIRRLCSFITEVIETSCLALIASHASFKLGLAITIASIIVNSVTQGLFLSLRVDLFAWRQISTRFMQILMPTIALVIYGTALTLSGVDSPFADPLLRFLIASRILSSIVQISLETATAEYNLQKRVYLSPWVNYGGVIFVALTGTIVVATPSMVGIFSLIAATAAVRIFAAFCFYHQTKLAMIERPIDSANLKKVNPPISRTAERTLLLLSGAALSLAPAFLINSHLLDVFAIIIVVKNLIKIIAERPFRTVHVEIVRAAQFRQWDFVVSLVRKATIASLIITFSAAALAFTVASAMENTFISLCTAWSLMVILNGVLVLRLMSVGLDTEVSRKILALRLLAAIVLLRIPNFEFELVSLAVVATSCFAEVCVLAFIGYKLWRTDLASKIEFNVETSRKSDHHAQMSPSILNCLNCLRVLTPMLQDLGKCPNLILIKTRRAVRSSKKARDFIDEISTVLRKADFVIAVNSTNFILWVPSSSNHTSIKTRLFKKFPLTIESISELSNDSFVSLINGDSTVKLGPVSDQLKKNSFSFLAALEIFLLSFTKDPPSGQWWALSASGDWKSLSSTSTAEHNQMLHKVAIRAMEDVFISAGRTKTYRYGSHINWVLRPLGKSLAIYSAPVIASSTKDALVKIHNMLISDAMLTPADALTVSPAEFYMLQTILEELSKRIPIRPESGLVPLRSFDLNARILATTEDGAGKKFALYVLDSRSAGSSAA